MRKAPPRRPLAALCLMLAIGGTWQAPFSAKAEVNAWHIQLDNDQLTARDRYYSSGIHLGLSGRFGPTGWLPTLQDAETVRDEIQLSHALYTPDALSVRDVQGWDHPYNGTLVLGWLRSSRQGYRRLSTRVQAGVMGGAAGGEQVQNGAHDLFPAASTVRGWRHVMNSEPALQAALAYETPLLKDPTHPLTHEWRARAGSLSNDIYGGAVWRHQRSASWSFFGRIGSSLVAYDGILQGGPLKGAGSPHRFEGFRIRRLRGHAELGAIWRRTKAIWSLTYVGHSATFKGGLAHAWATLRYTKARLAD